MIYTVRTTVGREGAVIETLTNRVKNMHTNVKAIMKPDEIKGYLFVEGDVDAIKKSISGIPHVRGMIEKEVGMPDIKKFLETKRVEIKIKYGDIVEISGGPFKGERGRVTRVDEAKDEVTLELLEAAIPIPTTVPLDSVRIVQTSKEDKKEG